MDEDNVPSREECVERIDSFMEATKSNSAEAQEFLQNFDWDLNRAVLGYFEAVAKEAAVNETINLSSDDEDVGKSFTEGKILTNVPPPSMRLLSWNLDCLDTHSLKLRMKAVVKTVQKIEPDVVFFQEVINEVGDYFEQELPEYYIVRGNTQGYFVMTLLRIFTIRHDSHEVIPYPGTRMGRNLLKVLAHIGDRKFAFFNSHLESGKEIEHSDERKIQLRTGFNAARAVPSNVTSIFGGDLNLRDAELSILNGLSPFFDAWEACGSRYDMKFTWDTQRNSNKGIGDPEKRLGPRCRFDRLYIRPEINHVRIKEFSLIGAERAPKTQMFPSDHWGILLFFDLIH